VASTMALGAVTPSGQRRNLILGVAGAVIGVAAIVAIVLLVTRDNGSGSHPSANRTPLAGFGTTHVTVETSSDTLAWCMLLAETEAQRNRGLMQVTDPTLGGYDGMVFRFDGDTSDAFYMRNTPMPLSIAFVSSDGDIVSTADMAPCEDRVGCPLYHAAAPYQTAIEVPQGQLDRLGITQGNKVTDDHRTC